jgi:hypothetical protein
MLLLHIHAGRVANFPGLFLKLETEVRKQSKMRGNVLTSPQALIEKEGI